MHHAVPELANHDLNDAPSSCRLPDGTNVWLSYNGNNLQNGCRVVCIDNYIYPDLGVLPHMHSADSLSSLRPLPANTGQPTIVLFDRTDFCGEWQTVHTAQSDLRDLELLRQDFVDHLDRRGLGVVLGDQLLR